MTSQLRELRLGGIASSTGYASLRDPSTTGEALRQTVTPIARHLARLAGAVALAVITINTGAAHASAQPAPQWTTVPVAGPSESVQGVACQSTGTCIAVGSVSSGMFPGGAILRSTDLGRTWTNVSFPNANGTQFLGVTCSGKHTCVAAGSTGGGGVIEVSNDGGNSWAPHNTSAAMILYGATCPSVSMCKVVGTTSGPQRRAGIVVSTDDSGRTWHRLGAPSGTSDIDSISCPTTRMCVTAGDKVSAHFESGVVSVGKNGESGVISVTQDGGKTWKNTVIPQSLLLDGVACPSVNRCTIVGFGSIPIRPTTPGVVVTTANGGRSWTKAVVPKGFYGLRSVSCTGSGACVAAGASGSIPNYEGYLLGVQGSAASWKQLSFPGLNGTPVNSVSCVSPSFCVAGGNTGGLIFLGPT
jgi:photosystem II stability/assembly factor-like uncharacterized protein